MVRKSRRPAVEVTEIRVGGFPHYATARPGNRSPVFEFYFLPANAEVTGEGEENVYFRFKCDAGQTWVGFVKADCL